MKKKSTIGRGVSMMGLAVALASPEMVSAQQALPVSRAPMASSAVDAPDMPTTEPLTATAGTSQAADADIVVTGFRSSLAAALNIKRAATGVVDVIKAEDIAKFPDANLAESLQRVPGVAVQREGGEGRTISVRGLGADFTRVRLNGMEAQAVSTGPIGLVNRGRGFDFNVFASELFNELVVRKTSSAEIEEGSLGATVDLRAGRPFDYRKGFTLVTSAKANYNDMSNKANPRLAGLIADTFGGGRFGYLFSAAYSKTVKASEGYNSGQWDTMASNNGFCDPRRVPTVTNPSACFGRNPVGITPDQLTSTTILHPRFPRYGTWNLSNERYGFTGALQWAPNDRTEVSFDALYSRQRQIRQNYWLTSIGFNRGANQQGKPEMVIREGEIRDNSLVYAVVDNIDLRSENELFDGIATFRQFGLELKHQFSDRLRLHVQIGESKSGLDEDQLLLQADRINSQGYVFDMRDNGKLPVVNYNFNTLDPSSYYVGPLVKSPFSNPSQPTQGLTGPDIRIRPQYVDTMFRQGSFDLQGDVTEDFTVRAGFNYRTFETRSDTQQLRIEAGTPPLPAGTTNADLLMPIRGFRNTPLPAGVPTNWLVPSVAGYDKAFGILSGTGRYELTRDLPAARSNIWSVREKDTAAYLQANFKTELAGITIRGDAGTRYVRTQQSSTGFQEAAGAGQLITVKRSYENWLPALNLAFEPSEQLVFRFAASQVMSRPALSQLIPSGSVNATGGGRLITSGNPLLDPITANTIDLTAEWYFAPGAILSAGFFYKKIGTYIQVFRETRPFSTSGLPDSILSGTSALPTDLFDFSVPLNTDGGPLKGLEINFQAPFRFLPGFLSNFGLLANYTYTDSKISYIINATTRQTSVLPLIGLSKHSANGTFYYEDKRLSARASANYRSSYLRQVPTRGNQDSTATGSQFNVDASISYKLTDRMTISLEGLNLTDTYEYYYEDSVAQRPEAYRHYGREYYLGVRYNF